MRRFLSLSLALALVYSISLPVRAELLKNVKLDGSIETRSFGIDNETDRNGTADDYRSETNVRVMVGTNFDLLDDVHARLLVDRSPRMGTAAGTVTTVQDTLTLDNAYVKIDKVFGSVDLTIGRQFLGPSDSDLNVFFGPNGDDLLTVASVDSFRADTTIGNGLLRICGVAGQLASVASPARNANQVAGGPLTYYGGEIGSEKLVPHAYAGLYYYTMQTHIQKSAAAVGNNTLTATGLRVQGGLLPGLGYHAEYIQNFGRANATAGTPAYHGNAAFLGLKYGTEVAKLPVRAQLEVGRGSDDFLAINPAKRFGLIWGEHSTYGPSALNRNQANGLCNLKVADIGVGVNPLAKLGVDVNAYRFMYDAGTVANNGKTSAGTEYDLILSWKHSDNVSFEVNAATFQVGDALQNAGTATSPITRLGSDVKIKF
ncbi:MAG: alginate export family protein [Elusimicrobiota bacterium]|jgi:hypothetical protein